MGMLLDSCISLVHILSVLFSLLCFTTLGKSPLARAPSMYIIVQHKIDMPFLANHHSYQESYLWLIIWCKLNLTLMLHMMRLWWKIYILGLVYYKFAIVEVGLYSSGQCSVDYILTFCNRKWSMIVELSILDYLHYLLLVLVYIISII